MSREINRLTTLFLMGFALVMLGTAYWSLVERENLRQREDNPRRVLAELNIQRGEILDRDGKRLAYSERINDRRFRVYPYPEVVGALGYYSYAFGATGLEDGMNDWLSGDDFRDGWKKFAADIVHHEIEGGDIQITLDLALQQQLFQAMQGQNGGALVVHVPSGEILAMVSQPTYDPNKIVEESLTQSSVNFLPRNRVTERFYQPGGLLQTLILSELLAAGVPLDKSVSSKAVELADPRLTLTCNTPAESDLIPLWQAYLMGCPFATALDSSFNPESLLNKFEVAGLLSPPRLDGFSLRPDDPVYFMPTDPRQFMAEAAGQGDLTITPLQAIQIIAAVVNNGNGVPLHLIEATRSPEDDEWQPFSFSTPTPAILQPAIALQIQSLLEANPLANNLYGHLSHAYAGNRQYSWFVGWTALENGDSIMMVLVLEGKEVSMQDTLAIAIAALGE